jgi:hypothetical protein
MGNSSVCMSARYAAAADGVRTSDGLWSVEAAASPARANRKGTEGDRDMSGTRSVRRAPRGRPKAEPTSDVAPETVTRSVRVSVQNILWGRAAGRCQLCNRALTRSPLTQETRNLAERAHIRAFSLGGPRAESDWPAELINDVENLLLLCQDCHVTIDRDDGPQRYTAAFLTDRKLLHEQRIETTTSVSPSCHSHVVTYGTFVGAHQALPSFRSASEALFPTSFPASREIISLGTRSSPLRDHDTKFWAQERYQLKYDFERKVRALQENGDLPHLSIFALAPQPLLIDLGVLIGDITDATTYQLHREPAGWSWPSDGNVISFNTERPRHMSGPPALVLSVSATITPERVKCVLGEDAAVWMLTVSAPHNDIVKSPGTLREFRRTVRVLLDTIKAVHGQATPLHVFPALPVSLAIEFGRARMPKADAPWMIYDENQACGGFIPTFTIPQEKSA